MESSDVRSILQAAEAGDKKTLQGYIAEGKVGVVDEDGNTPLMFAAASGREEIMRMLLDKDCITANQLDKEGKARYVDQQNRYGWTALMQASCYGHSGAVVLLLQRAADVQLCNAWKVSSLVLASQGGHFGIVHSLINHGAKIDLEAEEEFSSSLTPLMAAAQCGHVDVVQELIRGGAKLEMKLKATLWTALMFAVLNNHPEVVDLLLKSGADKEVKDIQGKMAVELASSLGHYGIVRLLAGGILTRNVSFCDSDFLEVVNKGNLEKVQEMLGLKPSMAALEDKDGATPLMYASNKGFKDICEALLKAKAEVNIKDRKYGWTALMHATHYRKYEVVELLGRYGADVNVRDNSGSTAFDIASMIGDIKMIKLIANITVERIKSKDTPTEPATPTNTQATPSITVMDTPTSDTTDGDTPSRDRKPSQPINLSELRSRLQNAYRTPTPKLAVPGGDNSSGHAPNTSPRFPSARNPRPSTLSASSHTATPSNNLRPGPGLPSPSKSAGSFPANKLTSKSNQAPPTRVPAGGRGPVVKPSALGTRGGDKTNERTPKYALKSPSRPGLPNMEGGPMSRTKPAAGNPFSILSKNPPHRSSMEVRGVARGEVMRKRAHTEPTSPAPVLSSQWSRQRSKHTDLKSILEDASMGKYYATFQEQEVDYDSFISLTSGDLLEMGIADKQAQTQLMALITQLNTSFDSNTSTMNSDVFVFH